MELSDRCCLRSSCLLLLLGVEFHPQSSPFIYDVNILLCFCFLCPSTWWRQGCAVHSGFLFSLYLLCSTVFFISLSMIEQPAACLPHLRPADSQLTIQSSFLPPTIPVVVGGGRSWHKCSRVLGLGCMMTSCVGWDVLLDIMFYKTAALFFVVSLEWWHFAVLHFGLKEN